MEGFSWVAGSWQQDVLLWDAKTLLGSALWLVFTMRWDWDHPSAELGLCFSASQDQWMNVTPRQGLRGFSHPQNLSQKWKPPSWVAQESRQALDGHQCTQVATNRSKGHEILQNQGWKGLLKVT